MEVVIKPSSAKAKGRNFQYQVRDKLLEYAINLEKDDVRSNPMGAHGSDILLSPAARRLYPYEIECKCVEKLNIWGAIKQAKDHGGHTPLVAFTKNHEDIYVAIPMETFLELQRKSNETSD